MTAIGVIARNVSANYVGVFGQLIVAFLLTPFLVHSLGDERYGVWSIIAAFTGYLNLFDLGVVSAITKYTAQRNDSADSVARHQLLGSAKAIVVPITIFLCCISPFVGLLLTHFVNIQPELHSIVRICAMMATLEVAIFVYSGLYRGTLFGDQRYDIVNAIQLLVLFCKALLLYAVLSLGYGLTAMSLVTLSGMLLLAGCMWLAVCKTNPNLRYKLADARKETAKEIASFSRATFLSMIAVQLIYYSDAFVIGYFMTVASVTYYSIAWALSEYVNRLMVVSSRVFMPVFSSLSTGSQEGQLESTFLSATRYQMIISNLICIGMLVYGDSFLNLWMGPRYAEVCTPLLQILFLSQLIRGPQLVSYSFLQGTANHRNYARLNLLFAFANLALGIVLIQYYGLIGVALSTTLTQGLFFGVVVPRLTLGKLQMNLTRYLQETCFKLLVPTLVLIMALFGLELLLPADSWLSLVALALGSSACYLIAIAFLTLDDAERAVIRNSASRFSTHFVGHR